MYRKLAVGLPRACLLDAEPCNVPFGHPAKNWSVMNHGMVLVALVSILAIPPMSLAQGHDDPSFTDSMAMSVSKPLGPLSPYSNTALGLSVSAGYNFTRRQALEGAFMWNWIYASNSAIQSLQQVLQTSKVGGHGNVFVLTANYKYELRGKLLGTYIVGGPGWYHRTTEVTQTIPSGTVVPCQPIWVWWGVPCGPTMSSISAGSSSTAIGGNVGIGFTIRVGDAPYRWYVESRYHYAPTKSIATQLLTINVGFRY